MERCFNMLISDVGKLFRYLLFHLASWKKVQSLHLNSGKINSEYCRKQFEVLGVERKGLRWCSGVGIGHRTVGEYTTSVQHCPDLDFKRQIRRQDQICIIMCIMLLSNNDDDDNELFLSCLIDISTFIHPKIISWACVVFIHSIALLHIHSVTHTDSLELPYTVIMFQTAFPSAGFLRVLSAYLHLSTNWNHVVQKLRDW